MADTVLSLSMDAMVQVTPDGAHEPPHVTLAAPSRFAVNTTAVPPPKVAVQLLVVQLAMPAGALDTLPLPEDCVTFTVSVH